MSARREAFSDVPETCPVVDEALGAITREVKSAMKRLDLNDPDQVLAHVDLEDAVNAIDRAEREIKGRTTALRDALIAAHEARILAQDEANELRSELELMRCEREDAKAEVSRLEAALAERDAA
jgi:predicted  nucleic acid-binding Zn-ribbon protein